MKTVILNNDHVIPDLNGVYIKADILNQITDYIIENNIKCSKRLSYNKFNNFTLSHEYNILFDFENDDDATMFALIWG